MAFHKGFNAGAKYICEHLTEAQVGYLRNAEWEAYNSPLRH